MSTNTFLHRKDFLFLICTLSPSFCLSPSPLLLSLSLSFFFIVSLCHHFILSSDSVQFDLYLILCLTSFRTFLLFSFLSLDTPPVFCALFTPTLNTVLFSYSFTLGVNWRCHIFLRTTHLLRNIVEDAEILLKYCRRCWNIFKILTRILMLNSMHLSFWPTY